MEALIALRIGEGSRITKQVAVRGVLPSAEPLPEPDEVNIRLDGNDTKVREFLVFLVHILKEGAVVDWKLGRDADTSERWVIAFADNGNIDSSHIREPLSGGLL